MSNRARIQRIREEAADTVKSFEETFKEAERLAQANDKDGLNALIAESGIPEESFVDAFRRYNEAGGIVDFGAGRSLLQGLTFGFADELEASLPSAVTGLEGDYEQRVGQIRAGQRAFEAREPATALGMEALGTLPYMAIPALGAPRMAATAARAPSLARTMGYGAGIGAAEGALGGAGRAESMAEVPMRSLTEGVLSAGLGALAPAAVTGGARLFAGGRSAQDQAMDQLARAIPEETREQTMQRVQQRVDTGDTRPETLADIGGATAQRELRGLRGASPEVQAKTDPFIERRMVEQGERVERDVETGLGITDEDVVSVKGVIARQESAARPLYQQLRDENQAIDVSDMVEIFEKPSFRSSYDEVMNALRDRAGRDIPADVMRGAPKTYQEFIENIRAGRDTVVPFDFLDQAKRVIGSKGREAQRRGNDELAERLFRISSDIRDVADTKVAGYADARRVFAGEAAIDEAYEVGKKFNASSSREIQERLQDMNDSERQAFMAGAVEEIRLNIDRANDTADVVRRLAGSPEKRRKLAALMGGEDSPAFKSFMEAMNREASMVTSGRTVAGGSQTAAFQRDIEGADAGFSQMVDILMNPTSIENVGRGARFFQRLINSAIGRGGRRPTEVADYLLETDPRRQQQALQSLIESGERAERRARGVATAGRIAGGAAGMAPSLLDAGE